MDELLKFADQCAGIAEDVARMLGLPTGSEVSQRIAEYEKRGVIRGYQAIVNEDQLDLEKVTAVIEVKVTAATRGGPRVPSRSGSGAFPRCVRLT